MKSCKGIVIAEQKLGESSKRVVLYTDNYGKVTLYAKGAYGKNSGILAATSMFCMSQFELNESENFHYIKRSEILDVHYDLSNSFERLIYASFVAELVYRATMEEEKNSKAFMLLEKTLKVMEAYDPKLTAIAFGIKFVSLIGYLPVTKGCIYCGTKDVRMFSSKEGGYICEEHLPNLSVETYKEGIFVTPEEVKIINILLYNTYEEIFKWDFDTASLNNVFNTILNYIRENLDINKFNSLTFVS